MAVMVGTQHHGSTSQLLLRGLVLQMTPPVQVGSALMSIYVIGFTLAQWEEAVMNLYHILIKWMQQLDFVLCLADLKWHFQGLFEQGGAELSDLNIIPRHRHRKPPLSKRPRSPNAV